MLPEIARQAALRFGPAPALVARPGWVLAFDQLDELADEVAAGLAARGVVDGDVVALLLPSGPEYIVAYLAAAKLGAATTGVNPVYTPTERAAVLDVAQPRLVVGTAELLDGLPAGVGGADQLAVPRASGPGDLLDVLRPLEGDRARAALPPLAPSPERPVAIVFTSGTTGRPKGAVFGARQLDAIGRMEVPSWDDPEAWGGGGPLVAATQLAHVGFMTKLPVYLRTACRLHLLERWRAPEVLALVAAERIAGVGGVAPQLALLLADPSFDDHDLSCVRTIVAGGAASPPALVREARERFGAAYSIRYSSTESGGVGTGTAFDADDEEALHTVGRPRAGIEVDIRPPAGEDGTVADDRPLPAGEVGEICLRSPGAMQGYWRDPEATAVALRGGWLRTGDLGLIDERGCLRLAGRAKEMFIRGGYNVHPLEVEAVLGSHPQVAAVAVVPAPDPVMGEIGVAVVVPRQPGTVPDLDELRRFGRERLASFKLPERVVAVDELPLTAMSKIDRAALRRLVST